MRKRTSLIIGFAAMLPLTPMAPTVAQGAITAHERTPARLEEYASYGIWDMKVEELAPGPDGHWQAVVWVRDAAIYPVGLTDDGVMITLFDADGRGVQSIPTLFRASVAGSRRELEPIPDTMWLEKGDEVRVRLFIRNSIGFKPVRVRVGSNDRQTLSRTFPVK